MENPLKITPHQLPNSFFWLLSCLISGLCHLLLFLILKQSVQEFLHEDPQSTPIPIELTPSDSHSSFSSSKPSENLIEKETSFTQNVPLAPKQESKKKQASPSSSFQTPQTVFLAESEEDLFKEPNDEVLFLPPTSSTENSFQEEKGVTNPPFGLERTSKPQAGDLSSSQVSQNLRQVWGRTRKERHKSASIHQGSLTLYFMNLDEQLMRTWGGVRTLPEHTTFIGKHQEIISYDFLISKEGELVEIRNISQEEQPMRNFDDVNQLVRTVFEKVFPWRPLPRDTSEPFIRFRKQIRYLNQKWKML